jgi:hypothetical protein
MDAANQGGESSEFSEWMDRAPSEPAGTPTRAVSTSSGASLPSVMLADDIFESETRPRNMTPPPVARPGSSAAPPGRSVPPPPGRRTGSVPPPPQGRSVPPPPSSAQPRSVPPPPSGSPRSAPLPSSPFPIPPPPSSVSTSAPPISALPLKTAGTSVPPPSTSHWAPAHATPASTLPPPPSVPAAYAAPPSNPAQRPGAAGTLPLPPTRAPLGPPPPSTRGSSPSPGMPVVPMPAGTPTPPPVGTTAASNGTGANPFLTPIPPAGDALTPRSFLPPPPTPPPGLGRSLPPIPTAPPQKLSSSAPPLALGTTLPPVGNALMTQIAVRNLQRRGKHIAFAIAAAVLLVIGIKLVSSSSTASTQEATGIRASSKQSIGVKLLVDGKLIGMLPQEVKGMTPGEHAIVFDAGERYAQQRRTVELVPGEFKDLEPVTLKVTKGSAIFDVKTPGTRLALVSADERRELTDYSHAIDVDNTKSWTLEATKPGHKPVTLPIVFEERAERTFAVQLSEAGGVDVLALPAANVTVTDETASSSTASDKPSKAKKRRERGESASRSAQPAAAPVAQAPGGAVGGSGTCSLNINTIPSSHVTLDGRNLGTTPRLGVMVAAGSHNIVFSTENSRKSTITSCRAGETKTVAIRMPE